MVLTPVSAENDERCLFFPERARADVTQSWHFGRFFGPSRVHRIDSGIWRFAYITYNRVCAGSPK